MHCVYFCLQFLSFFFLQKSLITTKNNFKLTKNRSKQELLLVGRTKKRQKYRFIFVNESKVHYYSAKEKNKDQNHCNNFKSLRHICRIDSIRNQLSNISFFPNKMYTIVSTESIFCLLSASFLLVYILVLHKKKSAKSVWI